MERWSVWSRAGNGFARRPQTRALGRCYVVGQRQGEQHSGRYCGTLDYRQGAPGEEALPSRRATPLR